MLCCLKHISSLPNCTRISRFDLGKGAKLFVTMELAKFFVFSLNQATVSNPSALIPLVTCTHTIHELPSYFNDYNIQANLLYPSTYLPFDYCLLRMIDIAKIKSLLSWSCTSAQR